MSGLRWGTLLLVAALGLATGCASTPGPAESGLTSVPSRPTTVAAQTSAPASEPGQPASGSEAEASCLAAAQQLSAAEQVGQLYMMAIQTGTPVETAVAQLQTTGAGAVILLGNWTRSASELATYNQQLVAASPSAFPVIVAADQEGGLVQRVQGPGFETIPAATEQALLDADELRADWQRWGGQLVQGGVRFNLAPVADVVPADQVSVNQAVGQLRRGYGSDPQLVAELVGQVVQGLDAAGVASSVKHFPGLGQVTENTDLAVGYDHTSTLTDDQLMPFQAAIDAGASSVMVSSAIYTQVDAANPAVFSPAIVTGILRDRMGFDGVIISDDLGVAAAVASYPVANRGLDFLRAGGDMVIVADPQAAQAMVAATLAAAQSDPDFAGQLADKVARLFALKTDVGLMSCS